MNWYYKLWVGAIQKSHNNKGSFKTEKDKNFLLLMTFTFAQLLNLFLIDMIFFVLKINFKILFNSTHLNVNLLFCSLYFVAFYIMNYLLIFHKQRWKSIKFEDEEKINGDSMAWYFLVSFLLFFLMMIILYFKSIKNWNIL